MPAVVVPAVYPPPRVAVSADAAGGVQAGAGVVTAAVPNTYTHTMGVDVFILDSRRVFPQHQRC